MNKSLTTGKDDWETPDFLMDAIKKRYALAPR